MALPTTLTLAVLLRCAVLCAGSRRWGVLFGGDGRLLAAQLVAVLVTIVWVAIFFVPYFWAMRAMSKVRVGMEQELAGLDASRYAIVTTNELPTQTTQSSGKRKYHV
jgi:ammonia channel protein AmtB